MTLSQLVPIRADDDATGGVAVEPVRRRAGLRRLLVLALLAVMGVTIPVVGADPAHALCTTPQEKGRWVNVDPGTRNITRAELRFVCQDQILNGKPYPPGPPWYVHLYGKCHPRDCDWGEVGARRLPSGHVYAVYDQGFAKRYVYAKMSAHRPGQLWISIRTDFTDPGRADYTSHSWFRRWI